MRVLRSQYLRDKSAAANADPVVEASCRTIQEKKASKTINKTASLASATLPAPINGRRKSIIAINSSKNPVGTNIKLLVDNVDTSIKNLKVIVEFTSMDAMWMTRIYKTYENDMWHKSPRLNVFGKKKWFYYCRLCNIVEYKTFHSIKSHLNAHLQFYPYVCKLCCQKYTNRKSATNHLKRFHHIPTDEWNDHLTS